MSSELEVVAADGTRSVLTIGRSPHVLTELSVQVLPVSEGVRIEPTTPGASLHVDGEELFCKQLCVGEFVVIDSVRLRLLTTTTDSAEPAPVPTKSVARTTPVVASSSRRRSPSPSPTRSSRRGHQGAAKSAEGAKPRYRARKSTSWAPASAITAAVLVLVVFVVRQLRDSSWPHSPKHFVELAQAQFENNKLERALETLAFALRDATGDEHAEAVALDEKIRSRMLENAAAGQVVSAGRERDLLTSFVARYLQSVERPAARECVRLCDEWLAEHREVCSVHSQGKQMLEAVEEMRQRYVIPAALGSAESADDVLFAARSLMRFQWRDYVGALARIDAFLAANAGQAEVVAARASLIAEGEPWLEKRLRRLDRTIERGHLSNADDDLNKLERWVAIPAWQARIAERRAKWQARR